MRQKQSPTKLAKSLSEYFIGKPFTAPEICRWRNESTWPDHLEDDLFELARHLVSYKSFRSRELRPLGLPVAGARRLAAVLQLLKWSADDVDGELGEIGGIRGEVMERVRAAVRDTQGACDAALDRLEGAIEKEGGPKARELADARMALDRLRRLECVLEDVIAGVDEAK